MGRIVKIRGKRKSPLDRLVSFFIKIIVVGLVFVIIFLIIASVFRIKHITIENTTKYTDEELVDMIMTERTDKISFLFWLRMKSGEPITIPFVEKIDVSLTDKNTVLICAYNKLITGCVKVMGGYMYFDREGIVVESSSELVDGIPVISGLKFDKVVLYEPLEIQKSSLFDTILNLTKLVSKYQLPVTNIKFSTNYEVTLTCDGNRILLGKKDSYDIAFAQLPGILEGIGDSKLEIDMRNYRGKSENIIAEPLKEEFP